MWGVDPDTIVAVASPRTPAPRGIVRLSGPHSLRIAEQRMEPAPAVGRVPMRAEGRWDCGAPIGALPVAVLIWPTARSFTGEPCLEVHTCGAPPLLDAIVRSCIESGCRIARPGEFTMRAFLSGRIDLTQAEAILGVIEAEDDAQLRASLRLMAGGIGHPLEQLRQSLLEALAHIEAGLDFVEEDIEFITKEQVAALCSRARNEMESLLAQLQGRRGADAVKRVVLIGPPNVGKSSLFNALLERDAAIVQDREGTTRDPVVGRAYWQGLSIELIDTAGRVAVTGDDIAATAQALGAATMASADLLLECSPATGHSSAIDGGGFPVGNQPPAVLAVRTKCDLSGTRTDAPGIWVSSVTGEGVPELRRAIVDALRMRGDAPVGLAERCRAGMAEAAQCLSGAEAAARDRLGDEIVAAELRAALQRLGELVGAFYTDELLDCIFGQFCIGK